MSIGILQIRKKAIINEQSILPQFFLQGLNQLGVAVKVHLVVDNQLESVTAGMKLLKTLCDKALVIVDEDVINILSLKELGLHFDLAESSQAISRGRKDDVDYLVLSKMSARLLEKVLTTLSKEKERAKETVVQFHFFGLDKKELTDYFEQEVDRMKECYFSMDKEEKEWVVQFYLNEKDQEKVNRTIEGMEKDLAEKWPFEYIGQISLLKTINCLLRKKELTITAAESLTGGAFMSYLSSEPDTSQFFEGGMVTYSERVKNNILGVDPEVTKQFGVVSSECAEEMADQVRDKLSADIGISLTGAAGPSPLEGKSPGTVWIGLSRKGYPTVTKEFYFPYNRNENRQFAVKSALNMVRQTLLEIEISG